MDEFIILIPALNPPLDLLTSYISDLKSEGFTRIILVDDGSDKGYDGFFKKMEENNVDVFYHYKNLGKGRALKNAFNYILNNYKDFTYVICADADGQHRVCDIKNIAETSITDKENYLYLGSRDFDRENVPFKSRYGNKITSFFYKFLFHDEINDTQTGLRAIPKSYLEDYMDLSGERFSYEINMLINSSKTGKNIKEIPIDTVYIGENESSNFNAFKDSFDIYLVMFKTFFKFIISSLASWLVDIGAFRLILGFLKKVLGSMSQAIWISTLAARIISGIFNFTINKNLVFEDKSEDNRSVGLRYLILWLCQLILSAFLVSFFYKRVDFDTSLIKILVDGLIFIVSFKIQDRLIFS